MGAKVHSLRDCRAVPLFPCFCGDDGAVGAVTTDRYSCTQYESPYWQCNLQLDCLPMQFRRLGPRSRALVMSLYRAIVERFFIMRATGTRSTRPTTFGSFAFDSVFLKCNTDPCKMDLAGRNRKRAFGQIFRDTFDTLISSGYDSIRRHRCVGETFFYPATPFLCWGENPYGFIECRSWFSDLSPLDWDASRYKWTNYGARPWTYDFSMDCGPFICAHDRALRMSAFRCAYLAAGYCDDGSCAALCLARRCGRNAFSQGCDSMYGSTGRGECYPQGCSLPSLVAGRLCRIKSQSGSYAGRKFNLPALLTALRILSPVNAQTVKRPFAAGFPHVHISAKRWLGMAYDNSCRKICEANAEVRSFTCEIVYYPNIRFNAGLSFGPGGVTVPRIKFYYNYADRVLCAGQTHTDPATLECIMRWDVRPVYCGAVEQGNACVNFHLLVPSVKPGQTRFAFGGPAYPAKWAVSEGDVAFGAVSAFATDGDGHRKWIAKFTCRPCLTLGNCGDLMSVLATAVIWAGLAKFQQEAMSQRCQPNTFCLTCPATTPAAVFNEMGPTYQDWSRTLQNLRAHAACASQAARTPIIAYCQVRAYDCGGGLFDFWGLTPDTHDWVPLIDVLDNTWVHIGGAPGGGVSYDYKYIEEESCSVEIRHPWSVAQKTMQFGGFFGTFIFKNKAARQTQ